MDKMFDDMLKGGGYALFILIPIFIVLAVITNCNQANDLRRDFDGIDRQFDRFEERIDRLEGGFNAELDEIHELLPTRNSIIEDVIAYQEERK